MEVRGGDWGRTRSQGVRPPTPFTVCKYPTNGARTRGLVCDFLAVERWVRVGRFAESIFCKMKPKALERGSRGCVQIAVLWSGA